MEFRWPAEFEPQDGVLVAWPHDGTDWAPNLGSVERAYVALVTAIARFERVVVCVADAQVMRRARRMLEDEGTPFERIAFVSVEYDDTWLRDSGPVTLVAGDRFRLLDFAFTGWGGKFGATRDDRLVEQLFERGLFRNAERVRIEFALEGGGIESDGDGTVLSTTRCLKQRHPLLSHTELEQHLSLHLEARRIHLLEYGALEGDDTDAHIDTLARFAARDHIVYQACDDPHDAHFGELREMARELALLTRADGSLYRISPLPWADAIHDHEGRRLAASYANFLILNGAVLVPCYGDVEADDAAVDVLQRAFADRYIVPVPCRALIEQNGSLHCLTMQLPRGVLA
ncbi:MAG TPA: agmatine deiminase family protein [Candidatus Saccharimonadia bacterium]|nr:agmatine deiminase family protein [Candidatus Saccharimonadia bacterium]